MDGHPLASSRKILVQVGTSARPTGQVVGQSPQGNLATGTQVTVWTSAGR